MAAQDGASFEAMIHADRTRKKNEQMANQIMGRSKSAQNVNKRQKQEPRSPSLASRMGIQKRSSSTSIPTQNKNPFNPPSRPSSTAPTNRNQNNNNNNAARASRIASEIDSGNANINTSSSRNSSFRHDRNGESQIQSQQGAGPGLTIKGAAGPFTLIASNFDPGTTQADIETALYSELFDDKGNNTLVSCRVISTRPSVVAELVLTEKPVADKIIRKFHNLKADGRILKVVLSKSGGDTSTKRKDDSRGGSAVAQTIEQQEMIDNPPLDPTTGDTDMDLDETDAPTDYPATSSYDHEREVADRDRRDRDRNRDRDDYASSTRRDDRRDTDRPRDDRDRRRDDRDRDRGRDDDRDRERDRDRDRDRERDREHRDSHRERDRDYERRNSYDTRPSQSQPQSQQQQQSGPPPHLQQQPRPPPAYGNGFGRPPRGGYGNRGGYGFSRGGGGGYGGGRGGYRGGY